MSKQERVRNYLCLKILSGDFPLGHRIPTERDICEELAVSRITVRLALAELMKEGVIEGRGRKGYVVVGTPPSGPQPATTRKTRNFVFVYYPSAAVHDFEQLFPTSALYRSIEKHILQNNDSLSFQSGASFNALLAKGRGDSNIDGVFIAGVAIEEKIPQLTKAGIPFLVVDQTLLGVSVDAVSFDNFDAGFICGKRLVDAGKTRLLYAAHYFTGEEFLQKNYALRLAGVRHAVEGRGAVLNTFHVTKRAEDGGGEELTQSKPGAMLEKLASAISRLEIDGIVCGTYFAYSALRKSPGIDQAIEVCVINDSYNTVKSVFSINFEWEKLGLTAARRLYEKISDTYAEPLRILLPVKATP